MAHDGTSTLPPSDRRAAIADAARPAFFPLDPLLARAAGLLSGSAVLFGLFMWGRWWLARRGRPTRVAVGAAWTLGLVVFTGRFTTWRWVA